jgi:hypothetical protein
MTVAVVAKRSKKPAIKYYIIAGVLALYGVFSHSYFFASGFLARAILTILMLPSLGALCFIAAAALIIAGSVKHLPPRVLIGADDKQIILCMDKNRGYFISFSDIVYISHNAAQVVIQTQNGTVFHSLSVPEPEPTVRLLYELYLEHEERRVLKGEIELVDRLKGELGRLKGEYETRLARKRIGA